MATVSDLGRRIKAKYPGIYDDLPDDEVGRRIKTKYPESYGDFSDRPSPPPAPTAQNNPAFANMGNPDLRMLDLLPTAGGIAGGLGGAALGAMAGGVGAVPGEIAGSAAGGAAGEGLRQYLKGERVNPGKIVVQGGLQGAGQAAGLGVAKGLGMAASRMAGIAGKARGIEAIAEQPASKILDKFGNPAIPAVPGRPGIPGKGMGFPLRVGHIPISVPVPAKALDKLARTLEHPGFRRFMRQSPKGAANYLTSLFYADQPDATAQP